MRTDITYVGFFLGGGELWFTSQTTQLLQVSSGLQATVITSFMGLSWFHEYKKYK